MPRRKGVPVRRIDSDRGLEQEDEIINAHAQEATPADAVNALPTTDATDARDSKRKRLVKFAEQRSSIVNLDKKRKASDQDAQSKARERMRVVCCVNEKPPSVVLLGFKQIPIQEDNSHGHDPTAIQFMEAISEERIELHADGMCHAEFEMKDLAMTRENWIELASLTQAAELIHVTGVVDRSNADSSVSIFLCFFLNTEALQCNPSNGSYHKRRVGISLQLLANMTNYPSLVAYQNMQIPVDDSSSSFSLPELYDTVVENSVSMFRTRKISDKPIEQSLSEFGLVSTLKPYQANAVEWTLRAETETQRIHNPTQKDFDEFLGRGSDSSLTVDGWLQVSSSTMASIQKLPLSVPWRREILTSASTEPFTMWFNIHTGKCALAQPGQIVRTKGGVLADEMGLGKTLEVLCLIAIHPRPLNWSEQSTDRVYNANDVREHDSDAESVVAHENEMTFESGEGSVGSEREWDETFSPSKTSTRLEAKTPVEEKQTIPKYWQIDLRKHGRSESEAVCFCGRDSSKKIFREWVQCSVCDAWNHLHCCGFKSLEEAENQTDFECFQCVCQRLFDKPIEGKGTLIVCPASILKQWEHEISAHFRHGSFSVFIYTGLRDAKASVEPDRIVALSPLSLVSYDIVLTSFEVLSEEVYLTESPYVNMHIRSSEADQVLDARVALAGPRLLRHSKKYHVLPSPLVCVVWWRVCIDEAQIVENVISAAGRMARRLQAVNRWCISGTPVRNGRLADLQGMIEFLGQPPFCEVDTWKELFSKPLNRFPTVVQRRLNTLFSSLMLRRTKASVQSELHIPPQMTVVKRLRFSSIEAHFYKRQYEGCAVVARSVLKKRESPDFSKIYPLLLRLRQACSHPQVGSGGIRGGGVMSMSNILFKLIEEQRVKCEESQRKLLRALSALAGLARLRSQMLHHDAVEAEEQEAQTREAFLKEAKTLYQTAMRTFARNRKSCALFGLVSLSGCEAFCGRESSSGLLNISWVSSRQRLKTGERDHSRILLSADSYSSTLPVEGKVNDSSCQIQSNSSVPSQDVLGHCPFAKFDMNISRRILRMKVTSSASGGQNMPQLNENDEKDHVELHVWLFPHRVTLQASSAGLFVDVHSFTLPVPLELEDEELKDLSSSFKLCVRPQIVQDYASNHRSRSWRLLVETLHPLCLVGTSRLDPGSIRKTLDICNSTTRVTMHAAMTVELYEAEFDVDAMQELHVLTNLLEVMRLENQVSSGDAGVSVQEQENTAFMSPTPRHRLVDPSPTPHIDRLSQDLDGATVRSLLRDFESDGISGPDTTDPDTRNVGGCANATEDVEPEDTQMAETVNLNISAVSRRIVFIREDYISMAKGLRNYARDRALEHTNTTNTEFARDTFATWWHQALSRMSGDIIAARFVSDVKDIVFAAGELYRGKIPAFSDVNGLRLILSTSLKDLQSARTKALKQMAKMSEFPTESEVRENSHCRRCRNDWGRKGPVCAHCALETTLVQFRDQLFVFRRAKKELGTAQGDDVITFTGTSMDGQLYKDSQGEAYQEDCLSVRVLKALQRFLTFSCHHFPDHAQLCEDAATHIRELGRYQREFLLLRNWWRAQQNLLSALDELDQCVTPLQLISAADLSDITEEQRNGFVLPEEIDERTLEHAVERSVQERELAAARGQLTYLKNLARAETTADDLQCNQKACVICTEQLGDEICVIGCGHSFHQECAKWLMNQSPNSSVRCPVCRRASVKTDCMLASNLDRHDGSSCGVHVKGSWGTKVTYLLSDLMSLPENEKVVVFSQWNQMLDVVGAALEANSVKFERLKGRASYTQALLRFRADPKTKALLMTYRTGSKGLTLVEATHAFLLEPVLLLEDEAQAVNRIHRMGQTRPTTVHKYIIKDTVEEQFLEMHAQRLQEAGGTERVLSLASASRKGSDDQALALELLLEAKVFEG